MKMIGSAVVLILLISGCADVPEGPNGTPSEGSQTAAPQPDGSGASPPEPSPVNVTGFVNETFWSECTGFRVSVPGMTAMFSFPPPPPGWEDDNPATEFDDRFFQCERIAWGGFERGPVNVILELGGPMGFPPPECEGEAASLFRPIATIWFSDPEITAYARDVYKLNAFHGEFEVTATAAGGVNSQEWTWAVPGGVPSTVIFPDIDVPTGPTSHVTRIFWFHGNQTHAMDLTQEWQVDPVAIPGAAFRPATGQFEDPMLFATASDQREFVGRSERYVGMDVTASFSRFGDLQCESPFS